MIGCGNACFGRMGSIDPLNLNILVLVFIPRGFKQTSRIFITHLKENLGFQVEEDCNDCHVCADEMTLTMRKMLKMPREDLNMRMLKTARRVKGTR